jgi:hypothetical protein
VNVKIGDKAVNVTHPEPNVAEFATERGKAYTLSFEK